MFPQYSRASAPFELWPHEFSLYRGISAVLPCHLTLLLLDVHFFPCLISKRTSLLSQAGFLPWLLDFQHFGIACSCALRWWCLKSDQLWWTQTSSVVDLSHYITKQTKSALMHRVEVLLSLFLLSAEILNSTILWLLWPRWPSMTTSLMQISLLKTKQQGRLS